MPRPRVARIVKWLLIVGLLSSQAGCVVQDEVLIRASGIGKLEIVVKFLLENGADVNARNKDGETPLIVASLTGHRDIVKLLLDKGAHVELRGKGGMTPLMWASFAGHLDVVRLLVEKGADVNATGFRPALILACWNGCLDVVKFLLVKGADVNAKDSRGNTPLMWASEKGHTQIVELLKTHGAK